MRARPGVVGASVLAAAWPAAMALGQSSVQERANVTVLEIPVNVLGKDGMPIAGLEAKDFELWDDGKKQILNAVEVVDLPAAPGAASSEKAGVPASARRLWLFVFDLSYTSASGLLRARDGATRFVKSTMPDSDLAAVGTLSVDTGWKLLVNFTRDRAQLAAAIATLDLPGLAVHSADPLGFAFQPPGTVGNTGGGLASHRKGPNEADVEQAFREIQGLQRVSGDEQQRGQVTKLMNALAAMGRVLDSVRGRKHVVYLSEGFETRLLAGRAAGAAPTSQQTQLQLGSTSAGSLDSGTNQGSSEAAISGEIWRVDSDARFGSSSLQDRLMSSLALFGRSDAVLDAIDISGLRADGDAAGPKVSGTDALATMASETGGAFVRNANDLGNELEKVAQRTARVYLLVYQPRSLSKPGVFHSLRVQAKVPGAKTLARTGYYEPRPYASLSPLERLLVSGDLVTGGGAPGENLAGRLVVAPFASPDGTPQVPVVLELPGASLLAGDRADRSTVQIYAYANDAGGGLADYAATEVALDLARVRAGLESFGLKFYGTLYLPPGEYGVRVLARNGSTGRAGVFSAHVLVPMIPGGAPAILPPFFEDAPGRWVMVRAKPRADAPEHEADYPFAVAGESFIPAASPQLSPGAEARVAVCTYNFGPRGPRSEPLLVRGSVIGGDGASHPAKISVVKESDTERGGGRKLLLAFVPEGLAPGTYRLDVSVSDPGSGASGQAESSFEVR